MAVEAVPVSLDALRWSRILGVLSMDVTQPLFQRMGLHWAAPVELQRTLREVISTWREYERQGLVPTTPFHDAALGEVGRRFGLDWEKYLLLWGQQVYQHGGPAGLPVYLWSLVVKGGGLDGARDPCPPPAPILAVREGLRSCPPVRARRLLPTSEWDHVLLARGRYDDMDNPMEDLEGTATRVDFLRAWHEATVDLGPGELETLTSWARGEATRLGMPAEHLVAAGSWEALPQPPEEWAPPSPAPNGAPVGGGGA